MPRRGRVPVVVVMVAALSAFAALAGCGSAADVRTSGPARDTTVSPTAAAATEGATSARHGPHHRQSGTIRLVGGRHYVLPEQDPPPPGTLRPLVIVLHSFGGTWMRLERVARFQERARAHGLVVAYAIGRERSWNAGRCCGWAESHQVDDVAYLVDLVADLRVRMPGIDQRRIYLAGFSNGAMMTLRALCERPDVFAAGAGVAGALVSHCQAATPIHYLAVHGTADEVVPHHGGTIDWLGVTFRPVRELPVRIRRQAQGSVVEVRTHRCGHVWPTVRECGVDAAGVGLAFVRRFSADASGPHRATSEKTRTSRHSELW
jgi:poly(3-hydroxybutyrate) depolymerase